MSKKIDGVEFPPTTGEMLISFAFACVFGLLGIPSIFELKDAIPLALRLLLPLKFAMQAYTIGTTLIAGIIWLVLFFVLSHRLERCPNNRARVFLTLRWAAVAAAFFVAALVAHMLLAMRFDAIAQ